jgi:molybdopterin molybdotransferase
MAQERILSFADAVACVQQQAAFVRSAGHERVALPAAVGRILAADLAADRDFPAFDRSSRDGFAVHAGTREWRVEGEVRAGDLWTGARVEAASCIAIMTGAPVPEGADAVVMVEHVHRDGHSVVMREERTPRSGDNIVSRGSEAAKGDVVLRKGVRLGPSQVGIAAACGCVELPVQARPRVAVLATGDELVGLAEEPGPQQIRNSNSYALAAAVELAGGEAAMLEPARDTVDSLKQQLRKAFECDLVLVAGGVSAGKYDLAEQVLHEQFGAEFFFTGVRMQPGKPVVFGRSGNGKYFFGLPGNPVSALVTFGLLARPMLAALTGEESWTPRFINASLQEEVQVAAGLTRILPAELTSSQGGAVVRRVPWQGSGDMAALARSNAFLVLPERGGVLSENSTVTVWLAD